MNSRRVEFRNSREMTLAGIKTYPGDVEHDDPSDQRPAVILAHSFTGYKEVPHLKSLADEVAKRGMVALRFDFSDCIGESDGSCEKMRLTNQVDDLKNAVTFLEAMGEVDEERIGVAGHSLGGMTSILVASEDDRLRALTPISAPTNHEGEKLFQGKEIERWEEMGHTHFPSAKRGEVKIGWGFYEDLQKYDTMEVIGDIDAPVRFVHGSEDDIVPVEESRRIYEAAPEPKDLKVIDGADHLFKREEHQSGMVDTVAGWMEKNL
ncbi:MAG: dienelactone hydrolase family protein [Candidatus Nanohaloarchaeota archaeon QJJ-7]|nr:dienelactone hydrolase family protein [Candidatus Nanohaloarchaeota archaeon QJJ-7]